MNTEQERAEFEAWAISECISVNRSLDGSDGYFEGDRHIAWKAWKARAALSAAQEAPTQAAQAVPQEPFGYFRAGPFGWTDCAETDEGAKALYEHPPTPQSAAQPGELSADALDAKRTHTLKDGTLTRSALIELSTPP